MRFHLVPAPRAWVCCVDPLTRGFSCCAEASKGFGFVEFEDEEDARAALDNMDGVFGGLGLCVHTPSEPRSAHVGCRVLLAESELFGRTLRVSVAKPERPKLGANKPGIARLLCMTRASGCLLLCAHMMLHAVMAVWAQADELAEAAAQEGGEDAAPSIESGANE